MAKHIKPKKTYTESEALYLLRAQVGQVQRGAADKGLGVPAATQSEAAGFIGISPQYLSDMLAGKRAIGEKVLQWLGLERVVIYRVKP